MVDAGTTAAQSPSGSVRPCAAPARRSMIDRTFVLTLSCPNRPGIVAAVSTRLYEVGCNILDAQQFDDLETGSFFMRVVFNPTAEARDFAFIREALAAVADRFGMAWTL